MFVLVQMGRPKDQRVWRHYHELGNKSVKCKFCDKVYRYSNIAKMTQHLIACFKSPPVLKKQMKTLHLEKKGRTGTSHNFQEVQEGSSTSNTTDLPTPTASTSTSILQEDERHSTRITESDLAVEFSKAIFVTATPLSMVEHPLWINFFKKLQFKMPSRKALATKYLDQIYNEMRTELSEELQSASYLHLQCDGWSNLRVEGIINFVISKPQPVFIKSLNTETNRHTSQYIASEIENVMKTYGVNKFVVLIGDNAKNMQKAFEIVKNKYPHITPLGCCAHVLNLLSQDCSKSETMKNFIDEAVNVIKIIKKSQILSAQLSKIIKIKGCGEKLKLPVKTRWGSTVTALKSLKKNKAALQSLAVDETVNIPRDLKRMLLEEEFWNKTEESIKVIEPITECIFELEGNDHYISKVFIIFKNIKSKLEFVLPSITMLSEEEKFEILVSVDLRASMCVKPIHMAAYMLDPREQGLELNQEQELLAMEFIYNEGQRLNLDVTPDLANYKAKECFWGKQFVWRFLGDIEPVVWWKGICSSTQLSKVALRILTAPCTSAATERTFSAQANVHSIKRNRLTAERAAKITFVSYNWNILHRKTVNESLNDDQISEETPTPHESSPQTDTNAIEDEVFAPSQSEATTSNELVFVDCGQSDSDNSGTDIDSE